MEIKINIEKRHFFVLLGVILMTGIVVFVGATAIDTKVFHGTDQVDWGQPIVTNTLKQESTGADSPPILAISASGGNDFISIFGGRDHNQNPFIAWKRGPLRFAISTTISGVSSGFDEKMRITDDGKVGIGINNPSAKLDVNGDVKVNGVVSSKMKRLDGVVQITSTRTSGGQETCWFKVLIDNKLIFPDNPCSGNSCMNANVNSANIKNGECHFGNPNVEGSGARNIIESTLEKSASSTRIGDQPGSVFLSNKLNKKIFNYVISEYNVQGDVNAVVPQGQQAADATFNFYYPDLAT